MGAHVPSPFPRLVISGLLMEAGFVVLGLPGTPLQVRVTLQIAIFAGYLGALWVSARGTVTPRDLRWVLGFAVLFRLTLLIVPPFYSDDLYRYLWDGHVQVAGHLNPYLYPPNAPQLASLRDEFFPLVNHPDIPTIYPPVAQIFFAAVVWVGKSVPTLKGALVLADLAVIWLLLRLLGRVGLPEAQVLVYAWSPLVAVEVAGNGHIDVLAALLLVAGIRMIILERPGLSTALLGLSVGSKFFTLLTFPVLARWVRRRFWPLALAVPVLVYLPYASAGPRLFAGLRAYAGRWQHNDGIFTLLLWAVDWIGPTEVLKGGIAVLHGWLGYPAWLEVLYRYAYPPYLARLAASALALGLALNLARRRSDPIRGCFILLGGVLLLSPTVYPWYFVWILPLLPFCPNRAWILLTGLVPLSYLNPAPVAGGVPPRPWVQWTEYLPFFAILIYDAVRSSRRGDPTTLFSLGQVPSGRGGHRKGL